MKKSMKIIIAAATVVSLACIGTVSYAAWSTDNNIESVSVTGSTGIISSIEGVTVTPDAASGTISNMKKLLPVDHIGTVKGAVKYWKLTLSVEGNQPSVTYNVSGTLGSSTDNWGDVTGLYWSATTPTADSGTKIGGTASMNLTESNADGGKIVYIFLKADTVEAMNAQITLEFGAS